MSDECDDCNEHCLDYECEEIEPSLREILDKLNIIKGFVSEDSFQRKIKTTNKMIQSLTDLDEKVTDNLNRLNEMLKKLKGVVAVALGNLSQ